MAPYNFFPATYQNPYSGNFQQPGGFNNPGQQMQQPPMQQQNIPSGSPMGAFQPQQQTNGFIPVQSENEARMYPLAPGTSATFIDENAPYCYTKTLGASQLDRPTFKRFRLVEEDDVQNNAQNAAQAASQNGGIDLSAYALQADLDAFSRELGALQRQVDTLMQNQAKKPASKPKKEDDAA